MTSRRALEILVTLLALAGIAIAILLVIEHQTVLDGDLAEGLFCGGAGRFDCSRVASHESSWLLGLPLALWGLMFYIVMLGLSLFAIVLRDGARSATIWTGALLATVALAFDAYLAWVMFAEIGAVCLNCVATYGINLLLAVGFGLLMQGAGEPSWSALMGSWLPRQDPSLGKGRAVAKTAIALVVVAGLCAAFYFTWQPLQLTREFAREETIEFLEKTQKPPEIDMARFAGHPSRGPADAPLVIAVSGPFQCSYCRAVAAHLERLEAKYRNRIRVVFVNWRVGSVCNPAIKGDLHEDACWLARVAECAVAQGKFWQYHDYLYSRLPLPDVTQETVSSKLRDIGLDPEATQACLK